MIYNRVIPRDLFNDAKLLKCLGKLSLHCLDETAFGITAEHENTEEGFKITLYEDGSLFCENIIFTCRGNTLFFKTIYNSRENYPFFLEHNYEDIEVFDSVGEFTTDFISTIESL